MYLTSKKKKSKELNCFNFILKFHKSLLKFFEENNSLLTNFDISETPDLIIYLYDLIKTQI